MSPKLVSQTFEVSNPTDLYDFEAIASKDVGITLAIAKNDDTEFSKDTILFQDRAYGLGDNTAQLNSISLPIGKYSVYVAKDSAVETTLDIRRKPSDSDEIFRIEPPKLGEKAAPISVSTDVIGPRGKTPVYLKPTALDEGHMLTATLSFIGASASLNLYNNRGERIGRASGPSPLTLTGIKGKGHYLSVTSKLPKNSNHNHWRMQFASSENANWIAEGTEFINHDGQITPNLLSDTNKLIEGYLDSGDEDSYMLPALANQALYFVHYAGPNATLVASANDNALKLTGRDIKLGPFSTSIANLIQIERGNVGPYTLTYAPYSSRGSVALEPDSKDSRREFNAKERVSGTLLSSADRDTLVFDLGDTAQMWRTIIIGENIQRAYIYDNSKEVAVIKRTRSQTSKRLSVPDFYFSGGKVTFSLRGVAGDYKVFLKPLGPPLANSEREPNHSIPRRIGIGDEFKGILNSGDIDLFSFYLRKRAKLNLRVDVPVGAEYTASIYTNGAEQAKPLNKISIKPQTAAKIVELPAGEHIISLRPRVSSPAEYTFAVDYIKPEPHSDSRVSLSVDPIADIKAFERAQQRLVVHLKASTDLLTSLTQQPSPKVTIWSPELQVNPVYEDISWEAEGVSIPLLIEDDVSVGTFPINIAIEVSDDVSANVNLQVNAVLNVTSVNPQSDLTIDTSLYGGINVALAALGAKWLSLPAFELDPVTAELAKKNPANAANIKNLNDGLQPTGKSGYATTLFSKGTAVYTPTLDLPGDVPIPLAGVGLTDRVKLANQFSEFSIAVSNDLKEWRNVLTAKLNNWGERQYFSFNQQNIQAKYVRLTPIINLDSKPTLPFVLSEFEVIANPSESGLSNINIADIELGALGREFGKWAHARDFQYGFADVVNDTVDKNASVYGGVSDWTETLVVKTFKNQSIAEIDALVFHFGSAPKKGNSLPPKYAKILGSKTGPKGAFETIDIIEFPSDFGPGDRFRTDFAQRAAINAIRVEYALATEDNKKNITIPAFYEVIERAESKDYRSILGLDREFEAVNRQQTKDNSSLSEYVHKGGTQLLPYDQQTYTGRVQFQKRIETWRLPREGDYNTVRFTISGEQGFFPAVAARDKNDTVLEPLSVEFDEILNETTYRYDLGAEGILLDLLEPARSTVFLVDQSPSVASLSPQIRRAVFDFADDMAVGRDAILFKSLGRDWSSAEWLVDPILVRRSLHDYPTGGNSNAEGAISQAAERLIDREGARTIIVIADGDTAPEPSMFDNLSASKARVFVIKISSAQMWGNPRQSIAVAQQWAATTDGEMQYVLRTEDVSTAYARVGARLMGDKAYKISATGETRVILPGQLSVTRSESIDDQRGNAYHVLFDASGSMLKRTGNTRRIAIAKQAVADFVTTKLTPNDTIGLRVFGGAPDTCESHLALNPNSSGSTEFLTTLDTIQPQNNAKTPIALALSYLRDDLKQMSNKAKVLLITDGKETCEGNAAEVIEQIIQSGLASRFDIVSFALDKSVDRSEFNNWAKSGRGLYIDAQDGDSLVQALARSIEERVEILQNGVVISQAVVGGSVINLNAGDYVISKGLLRIPITIATDQITEIDLSNF